MAGLIADANGNLFGTTVGGGGLNEGLGTVFQIEKTATGYASTPTTLVSLNATSGASPFAGLIADANGNLFGTTFRGGASNSGTVFEVTGSGFVPPPSPPMFAGTPGRPNCTGQSVSALAQKYGGINNTAAALGFSGVAAKRNYELLRMIADAGVPSRTKPIWEFRYRDGDLLVAREAPATTIGAVKAPQERAEHP